MSLKGTIQPDHIPVNKYSLVAVGVPPITFTSISGLETEVAAIDLPDRTKATGGQVSAGDFEAMVPMHHSIEIAAMDVWYREAQDPVSLTYKKAAVLEHRSGSGEILQAYALVGLWVHARKLPDLSHADDGAMAQVEYTLCFDSCTELPV